MTLRQVHDHLATLDGVTFTRPGGQAVPAHFHLTELGEVTKAFVDCGGQFRRERRATLQLWTAEDYDHRLTPAKFRGIIEMGQTQLGLNDEEVEVEYQMQETIGRYGLVATDDGFQLTKLETACLALDACGVEQPAKPKRMSVSLVDTGATCTPGGGCC